MATIKELKEWLNQFPEDTIVEVGIQQKPDHYQSYGSLSFECPKLDGKGSGHGWEFKDFRNNQFVKETDPFFGKYYLQLGESW